MSNNLIDKFLQQANNEKPDLEARISCVFPRQKEYLNNLSKLLNQVGASVTDTEIVKAYAMLVKFQAIQDVFRLQINEINLTICEKLSPTALQRFMSLDDYETGEISFGEATIGQAYEYLRALRPSRCKMILSLANNGAILFEYVQQQNYEGFLSAFSRTEKGLHDILVYCNIYSETANFLNIAQDSQCDETNTDDFKRLHQYYYSKVGIRSDQSKSQKLYECLAEPLNTFLDPEKREEFLGLFKEEMDYLCSHTLAFFCRLNHFSYFEFTNDVAMDVICNDRWSDYTIPMYFELLEALGYSIEEDVIKLNAPDHQIVAKAKEYLESKEPEKPKTSKGRKKMSWINILPPDAEEEFGMLIRDEIWPELEKRLKRFTYVDSQENKIQRDIVETAIKAIGACFIYYAVDSLGWATKPNEKSASESASHIGAKSSFERTIREFVDVSRNTIDKYMKIFEKYAALKDISARRLDDEQSYELNEFAKEEPALCGILVFNMGRGNDKFAEIIDYLMPKIKELIQQNTSIRTNQ